MSNSANVSAGKPKVGGAIYKAPFGTTLPTTATEELDEAFVSLGYCGDSGLKNSKTSETGEVHGWGGETVLTYTSTTSDDFAFTLIECLNVDVLKTVYGSDNVTGAIATGITIKANSKQQAPCSWVVDMILNGAVKRIVVPYAGVKSVGDVTYSDSAAIGYETTIAALPDSDGNTHYEYIKSQQ